MTVAEDPLAEQGAEGDTAVEGAGEVAHRLAPAVGGHEVGDGGGRPDVEGGLADPLDEPEDGQHADVRGEGEGGDGRRHDRRAADDDHPPAAFVAQPAGQRPGQQGGDEERADDEPDSQRRRRRAARRRSGAGPG